MSEVERALVNQSSFWLVYRGFFYFKNMRIEGEYSIGVSGRVKAAGVPMDTLFETAEGFQQTGRIFEARQVTEEIARLRQAPPEEIRDRFFPRDRGNKAMFRSGPLLLRPIL